MKHCTPCELNYYSDSKAEEFCSACNGKLSDGKLITDTEMLNWIESQYELEINIDHDWVHPFEIILAEDEKFKSSKRAVTLRHAIRSAMVSTLILTALLSSAEL